jgi:hypothetical protein
MRATSPLLAIDIDCHVRDRQVPFMVVGDYGVSKKQQSPANFQLHLTFRLS